jgi:DNA-binding transcriptional MocR family regulator
MALSSYLDEPNVPELIRVLRDTWPYPASDMIIVDGAMDGIELATRVLVRFGDRVIIEDPAFPPTLDLLEASGAEIIGVRMDDGGMDVEGLREALAGGPVAALYLQPRAQNPTGIALSERRCENLAQVLKGTTTIVIEDDSAGSVSIAAPISLGKWLPESTLHIRSFSKSHGPDLRIAALSGPADLIGRINALRRLGQGWSSRLLQRILLAMLTDASTARGIEDARAIYAQRRQFLVNALAAENITVAGTDGINIWIPVKDESAAVLRLASQGIGVTPGTPFSARTKQEPHVRVTCGLVETGHRELAALLASAARGTVQVPA